MATKFVVAPKRTIHGVGAEYFNPGDEVSAETLGIEKKAFDRLVDEGNVVKAGSGDQERSEKRSAEEPEVAKRERKE